MSSLTFNRMKQKTAQLMNGSENNLVEQFMITLYSSYVLVKDQHRNNETLRPALEESEKLFKEPKTWRNANLIEQLLIPLL